jgi:hypothetical protein
MRKLLLIVIPLFWCSIAVSAEEPGRQVTVTGRAIGATEAAGEEAKLDALREAVRQVCGSWINAQTETEDYAVVRDKVLEQPTGFARVVKVLKGPQVVSGDITEVQLIAEVLPGRLQRRWAEFAHIKVREGNPRCVLMIMEDENADDPIPPVANGLVQTELENFFLAQKVQLMDKGVSDAVRQRDLKLAAETGDVRRAAAAGAAFKADIVLLGRAEARRGDSVMLEGVELKRWNVVLTVRAVQTDSAAILMSKSYRPKKAFTTASASGKDALIQVGKDAAREVLSDLGDAWRNRATSSKRIEISVSGCTRRAFKAVQDEMIKSKGVTGGKDGFILRELVGDVATIDADWKYDLAQLADRLEELNLVVDATPLRIEVTEQSANRMTARVVLAAPPGATRAPVARPTQAPLPAAPAAVPPEAAPLAAPTLIAPPPAPAATSSAPVELH